MEPKVPFSPGILEFCESLRQFFKVSSSSPRRPDFAEAHYKLCLSGPTGNQLSEKLFRSLLVFLENSPTFRLFRSLSYFSHLINAQHFRFDLKFPPRSFFSLENNFLKFFKSGVHPYQKANYPISDIFLTPSTLNRQTGISASNKVFG